MINQNNELVKANQFFSSVIHDIRTPMNAVMGFLELLEDDAKPKQKEYIQAAYKSSEMVVALINDVLDMNKISMGKIEINNHFFSLLEVMENTALLFYHNALQKDIDFIIYYDPHIPYLIKSDPFRIKQVLNNLLSNAIKFTDVGGMVALEFLYEATTDTLICKVSDTGIGISQKNQKDIFKPFTQASIETSGKYGGTGLGLTISKQLALLLGGDLYIQSEENKGSTFSIEIPCNSIDNTGISIDIDNYELPMIYVIDGELSKHRYIEYFTKYFKALYIPYEIITSEDAIKHTNKKENIYVAMKLDYTTNKCKKFIESIDERLIILETDVFSDVSKFSQDITVLEMPILPQALFNAFKKLTKGYSNNEDKKESNSSIKTIDKNILIADDNPINLRLMSEIVNKFGCRYTLAKNGQEAVDIFKDEDNIFDIILIDQNMPILTGTDAIKIIRSLPKGKNIYIYGLTGDSDENTNQDMKEAGANAILHKPIKIQELKDIIYSEV